MPLDLSNIADYNPRKLIVENLTNGPLSIGDLGIILERNGKTGYAIDLIRLNEKTKRPVKTFEQIAKSRDLELLIQVGKIKISNQDGEIVTNNDKIRSGDQASLYDSTTGGGSGGLAIGIGVPPSDFTTDSGAPVSGVTVSYVGGDSYLDATRGIHNKTAGNVPLCGSLTPGSSNSTIDYPLSMYAAAENNIIGGDVSTASFYMHQDVNNYGDIGAVTASVCLENSGDPGNDPVDSGASFASSITGSVEFIGTGVYGTMLGGDFKAAPSSGTVDLSAGLRGSVLVTADTVATLGNGGFATADGVIAGDFFVFGVAGNQADTTTAAGIKSRVIFDTSDPASAVDNAVGLLVAGVTGGTNNWGIYVNASSTANNFLAQSTRIGGTAFSTDTPDSSSILHLSSTTKGFLPPVMTAAQAESITTPATGLMVYSTTGTGTDITSTGWWGYNGSNWIKLG